MYAVIETGGKQYRVEVGTELEVELLDVEPGKTVTIDRVLLVADGDESTIGRPLVADASVSAEVVSQTRGPKLISFKYRPKARSRVKKGHRQELTLLRIADITLGGKSAAKDAKKVDDQAKAERLRLEEAAATQAAKDAELAAKLAVGAEAEPKAATKTKAPAKPKADAKTESTPDATAEATSEAKTEAKAAAPKRTTAKADADAPEADAPEAKAETPKKPRATKKDE
jgi:large subunit ribosomal protein L21